MDDHPNLDGLLQGTVQNSMDLANGVDANIFPKEEIIQSLYVFSSKVFEFKASYIRGDILACKLIIMHPGCRSFCGFRIREPLKHIIAQRETRTGIGHSIVNLVTVLSNPIQAFPLGRENLAQPVSFKRNLTAPLAIRQLMD